MFASVKCAFDIDVALDVDPAFAALSGEASAPPADVVLVGLFIVVSAVDDARCFPEHAPSATAAASASDRPAYREGPDRMEILL
jgi:hypothetical protein